MKPMLQAVVFDWAGTVIDFGSRAPVVALRKCFEQAGVTITDEQARADMGLDKRDHIAAIFAIPAVAAGWAERHGAAPRTEDGDRLFALLGPIMREAARECTDLIPGAAEAASKLQHAGVRVGSCTGYTRDMMAAILPRAAEQGYRPDMVVCAGETPQGRPSPLMVWKNLVELGAWPADACVKVDDAEVGIGEGRAAGVWTIGVTASGNGVGLSAEALAALVPEERAARIDEAGRRLLAAGAHLVIESVADLQRALRTLPLELPSGLG